MIIPSLGKRGLCHWNLAKHTWISETRAKIDRNCCIVTGSSILYIRDTFVCMENAVTYSRENKENKVASVVPTAGRSLDMDILTNFLAMSQRLHNLESTKKCVHASGIEKPTNSQCDGLDKHIAASKSFALADAVQCEYCRSSSNFCTVGCSEEPAHSCCSCSMEGKRALYWSDDNKYEQGESMSVSQNSWPLCTSAQQQVGVACKF
jgi:hypothetical protein